MLVCKCSCSFPMLFLQLQRVRVLLMLRRISLLCDSQICSATMLKYPFSLLCRTSKYRSQVRSCSIYVVLLLRYCRQFARTGHSRSLYGGCAHLCREFVRQLHSISGKIDLGRMLLKEGQSQHEWQRHIHYYEGSLA